MLWKPGLALLLGFCMLLPAGGQDAEQIDTDDEAPSLSIGSPAPELAVEHWVQNGKGRFNEVTKFEPGKVYVVEFWATWCGPCIASMPHLAQTQEEYADKGVQLISISDEDLETVETFLKRTVRRPGSNANSEAADEEKKPETYRELTSAYCLTTDPDQSSYEDYMVAAGENGIPTAFVVGKDGVIEWIGHPMQMDEPLAQVVAGTWDREAAIAQKQEEKARERIMMAIQGEMRSIGMMVATKKYDKALEKVEALEERFSDEPAAEEMLVQMKLSIQVLGDPAAAVKTLDRAVELSGDDAATLNELTWGIYEVLANLDDPNEDLLKAATGYAEKAVSKQPENGAIIDTLAHLVYLQGDLDRAIELQTKAVKHANGLDAEIQGFLDELMEKKKESEKK